MSSINNKLLMILSFVFLLLIAMSVSAGTQYIFPSDVIEPGQAQYNTEPANRYENQPNWRYPQEDNLAGGNILYPEPKQYQLRKKSSRYEQSDHYKYDDFHSNIPAEALVRQPARSYPVNNYPMDDFNREARYPKEIYPNQFRNEQSRKIKPPFNANKRQQIEQRQHFTRSFRKPAYASDFDVDGYITSKHSVNTNPYKVPSYDLKSNYDWKNDNAKQQVRVQYIPVPIPVPVYNVPGTLPGSIPGIVTPGDMVPGYSHLSPGYDHLNKNDEDIYDVMGSQYNPFPGFGLFPGGSNPFNGLYKSYSNNSEKGRPILSPDIIRPVFTKPETFLPY